MQNALGNLPHTSSTKYTPAVVNANVIFLNILQSGQMLLPTLPFFGRGSRERMSRFAIRQQNKNTKASMRVAHLNPTLGKRRCSTRGKIIPPMLPPVVARPVAAARLTAKKWAIDDMAGVKMRAVPKPQAMEKESMKCHSPSRKLGQHGYLMGQEIRS